MADESSDLSTYHQDVIIHELKFGRGGGGTPNYDTQFRDEIIQGVRNGSMVVELHEESPDSFFRLLVFRKTKQFKRLIQNIDQSKGLNLAGIEEECLAKLKIESMKDFIEDTNGLLTDFEFEAKSSKTKEKIDKILKSVLEVSMRLSNEKTGAYLFGSRKTELAEEGSDVDIYVDIGNSSQGSISENIRKQILMVKLFEKEMGLRQEDFYVRKAVTRARVPILIFKHRPTKLCCDLSFRSKMSVMNSELVKLYLDLDPRVKFVVAAVKHWFKQTDLAGKDTFTSYAQIWIALFFLMEMNVVPSVLELRLRCTSLAPLVIEGWNSSVPKVEDVKKKWTSDCHLSKEELLKRFFEFYCGCPVRKSLVLCPFTGEKARRRDLYSDRRWLAIFSDYNEKVGGYEAFTQRIQEEFNGFCVQDPFDLSKNLTRNIGKKFKARKMVEFVVRCKQTSELF